MKKFKKLLTLIAIIPMFAIVLAACGGGGGGGGGGYTGPYPELQGAWRWTQAERIQTEVELHAQILQDDVNWYIEYNYIWLDYLVPSEYLDEVLDAFDYYEATQWDTYWALDWYFDFWYFVDDFYYDWGDGYFYGIGEYADEFWDDFIYYAFWTIWDDITLRALFPTINNALFISTNWMTVRPEVHGLSTFNETLRFASDEFNEEYDEIWFTHVNSDIIRYGPDNGFVRSVFANAEIFYHIYDETITIFWYDFDDLDFYGDPFVRVMVLD
ncbi:MAG: hypothetical protein FWD89_04250 [Firmicutes bacterium]|nr:hypothetical protein [Bacillota bacterium]